MSGGVPKRVQISRTQRNTPSKAGNVVAKNAIVLCSGRRSRRAMCNYVKQRATPKPNVGANTPWWYNNSAVLAAITALTSYFASLGLNFVLVGESETLQSDIGPTFPVTPAQHIFHYAPGFTEYDALPAELKGYADLINSIGFNFPLNIAGPGPSSMMIHICGAVTDGGKATLEHAGYGFNQSFGTSGGETLQPGLSVVAYGTSCIDPNNSPQGQFYSGNLWNKTTLTLTYSNITIYFVKIPFVGTSCFWDVPPCTKDSAETCCCYYALIPGGQVWCYLSDSTPDGPNPDPGTPGNRNYFIAGT